MIKQYSYEKLNELWAEESEGRKSRLDKFIAKLQEIFEEYYEELYDFFIDIMEADYDYKFLIARRCLVLYQIFVQIFEYKGENIRIRGQILSDRIIPKLSCQLKGKKVLLIDDILIHGRRVNDVYEELISCFQCASVDVHVYMATDDEKCIKEDTISNIRYTEIAEGWKWKTLSDAIARAIYVSNIPYTSFVPAITIENKEDLMQPFVETECQDNTSPEQKSESCHSKVVFAIGARPSLFQTVSYAECIREYRSENRDNILLIPYSFTKSVRKDKIDDFFDAFVKHIGSLLPKICGELSTRKEDPGWNSYRLCLFNALLSQLVGVHFFHQDFEKHQDYDTLVKSFGEEISIEFLNMDCKKAQIILNDSYEGLESYICHNFQEDKTLANLYCEIVLSSEDVKKGYWSYLAENRKLDEERAKKNLRRLSGLSVDYVFRNCKDKTMVESMVLCLLSSMDIGCAAASYKLVGNEQAYASVIMTGELSFRIMLQRYPEIIRNMIFLEEKHADINDYITYLCKQKVIDSYQENELKIFYQDNEENLKNCYVVPIIENRKYWKIPKVAEAHSRYLQK